MKKFLSMLFAVTLIVACGKGKEPSKEAEEDDNAPQTSTVVTSTSATAPAAAAAAPVSADAATLTGVIKLAAAAPAMPTIQMSADPYCQSQHPTPAKDEEVVRALGYLSELVKEFAPPHQPDERLFKMLRACIEATANNPNLLQAITVYTELWTLKLTGLLPGARECGSCGARLGVRGAGVYISPEGALRCQSCRQAGWQRISAEEHELLASMRVQGPKDWAETFKATSDGGRQSVSDIAGRLVRRALEREPRASRSAHTAARTNGGEIDE